MKRTERDNAFELINISWTNFDKNESKEYGGKYAYVFWLNARSSLKSEKRKKNILNVFPWKVILIEKVLVHYLYL